MCIFKNLNHDIMKKKLVISTGAGISAESGLSTFRDANGLWEQYPVMEVASADGFARNPALVHEFYNARRKQLLEVEPNDAHRGLVDLEKDFDVRIITQNVDDLHERAGSKNVLHLHGELMKIRSMKDESRVYELTANNIETTTGKFVERNGTVDKSYANRQALLFVMDKNGTTQFVGQTVVGADGTYAFKFKTKDEPTVTSGDYKVLKEHQQHSNLNLLRLLFLNIRLSLLIIMEQL